MSYFQPFSDSYHYNCVADDSSTVFDADTVIPDEVPSLPPASQEESPRNFTSKLLRLINSQRSPAEPSITTAAATATRNEEISNNESSSSSSSKKRSIITNSSSHSSRKKTRQSSRRKRQSQKADQNCTDDKSDEAVINQSSSSQTSTTKEVSKHEFKWRSKFEELRAYKQLHGYTSVPRSNKELGRWVQTQRSEYRNFKANKYSCMTDERIQTLESIDFEWVVPNKGVSKNESAWNKRFNELKEYKEKFGHTNVSTLDEDNKELNNWMNKQRSEYRNFKANKKSQITLERIQTLESIDFEWVSSNKGGASRDESKWNERFNELKDYKEKFRHTNVSTLDEDNKQLGKWVSNQRKEYKKFKANKKAYITKERIQTLESIGFEWECRRSPAPRS